MTYQTKLYRTPRSERRMRPLFGLAAAAAAVATLGLAVIAPAQVATGDASSRVVAVTVAPVRVAGPAEVAIQPGHIHVVALRAKSTVRAAALTRGDGAQRT